MPPTLNPTPFTSSYPELKLPEGGFHSTLPEHLLSGADEQTRWLMHEISRNSAATEFACRGVVELSAHLRALNGKTYKNEKTGEENKEEVEVLKTKVEGLDLQMKQVTPVAATYTNVKDLASNKIFLIVLGGFTLFLLGYNREILPSIFKFFFGG